MNYELIEKKRCLRPTMKGKHFHGKNVLVEHENKDASDPISTDAT